jgi:hypothetical protein
MEATPDYWRIWYYLLDVRLVNPSHARQLAGRPKTDRLDAQWIARLTEMGLLRPSFVPPPEIRALRDLTRTRLMLVRDRSREWQRLEKLLEGALVKLSSVVSSLAGTKTARVSIAACSLDRSSGSNGGGEAFCITCNIHCAIREEPVNVRASRLARQASFPVRLGGNRQRLAEPRAAERPGDRTAARRVRRRA